MDEKVIKGADEEVVNLSRKMLRLFDGVSFAVGLKAISLTVYCLLKDFAQITDKENADRLAAEMIKDMYTVQAAISTNFKK